MALIRAKTLAGIEYYSDEYPMILAPDFTLYCAIGYEGYEIFFPYACLGLSYVCDFVNGKIDKKLFLSTMMHVRERNGVNFSYLDVYNGFNYDFVRYRERNKDIAEMLGGGSIEYSRICYSLDEFANDIRYVISKKN